MTELKIFKKLMKCAQEYIMYNAKDILGAIRGKDYSKISETCCCYEIIMNKYSPKYKIEDLIKKTDKEIKEILLEKFCIELQNQSGRSKAIKYFSYGKDFENEIFKVVRQYYNEIGNEEIKWCDLYNIFNKYPLININNEKSLKDFDNTCKGCTYSECERKRDKRNFGWREYSRGLKDVLKYIKNLDCEEFKNNLSIINDAEKHEERKTIFKKVTEQIHSFEDELVYDFFKELCCENLIKPDVHIKYLYNEIIKGEKTNSFDIAEDIIQMCKESGYSPYYADKNLWLCCTGNFYEDGITINAMNRGNFINMYRNTYYHELGI